MNNWYDQVNKPNILNLLKPHNYFNRKQIRGYIIYNHDYFKHHGITFFKRVLTHKLSQTIINHLITENENPVKKIKRGQLGVMNHSINRVNKF